jgi:transcriptional regulator with XRE-family HTH domain
LFLRHLREARQKAGLTQVELGKRLGQPQAIVSKCERGERRMDVIELRQYCAALGLSYLKFLRQLENDLEGLGSNAELPKRRPFKS